MENTDKQQPATNRQADHDWIEAQPVSAFKVTADGLLVWKGDSRDLNSQYSAAPDEYRCCKSTPVRDDSGAEVLGADLQPLLRRCVRWAMRRAAMCRECAGGDDMVKRAVKARLLDVADALVGELTELAMDRTIGAGDQIKAINSLLDRAGIRGGVEITPDVPAFERVWKELGENATDA